jgi:hypothetical protein
VVRLLERKVLSTLPPEEMSPAPLLEKSRPVSGALRLWYVIRMPMHERMVHNLAIAPHSLAPLQCYQKIHWSTCACRMTIRLPPYFTMYPPVNDDLLSAAAHDVRLANVGYPELVQYECAYNMSIAYASFLHPDAPSVMRRRIHLCHRTHPVFSRSPPLSASCSKCDESPFLEPFCITPFSMHKPHPIEITLRVVTASP